MELSRADQEHIEEACAQASRWVATMKEHLMPIAGPAVLESADIVLSDLVEALCLLDPARDSLDFRVVVQELFERKGRKARIAKLSP